ncbi:MAG TPA: SUMF1/EgtB/PvdO family nonheme iron enzyme [Methanosarcina sp.]|jgi:formylglycine-generating enzyme required for sulfatase activity
MGGRRIGLIIGTNEYLFSDFSNLEFAINDSRELLNLLKDPQLCAFDEVIDLTDKTSSEVSLEIEKTLKNAKSNDLILIYFSGHGTLDFENELCLCFKNTNLESKLTTSLNFSLINKCRRQSPCQSVVVILDCCYSFAAGIRGDSLEETLSEYSGSGTVILSSTGSAGSPLAKEDKDLKHGIFTYYLLDGLRSGDADEDSDGVISIEELYNYAQKNTVSRSCKSQIPKKGGEFEGKIIIGQNPRKIKEREFERKKHKLVEKYEKYKYEFPDEFYEQAMNLLINDYEDPKKLTDFDIKIKPCLESLLEGKMSLKIYVNTIQCLNNGYIKETQQKEVQQKEIQQKEVQLENLPIIKRSQFAEIIKKGISKKQIFITVAFVCILVFGVLYLPQVLSKKTPSDYTNSIGMEFMLINPGDYRMGFPVGNGTLVSQLQTGDLQKDFLSDNQTPVHKVTIKTPFYLGKYEVTQKQWREVMTSNPSRSVEDDYPVVYVSWDDAQEFVKKLNEMENNTGKYRLPSEAEWEYACRAGTNTKYSFGDDESKLEDHAWYAENSGGKTHIIGQKKPNPWRLYDMNGNVWEWVQDKWHDNYSGAPSNESAWVDGNSSLRIVRGGGGYIDVNNCTSSTRWKVKPDNRCEDVGFRLLREL